MLPAGAGPMVARAIQEQSARLGSLFYSVAEPTMLVALPKSGEAAIVPTATLIVVGKDTVVRQRGSSGELLLKQQCGKRPIAKQVSCLKIA